MIIKKKKNIHREYMRTYKYIYIYDDDDAGDDDDGIYIYMYVYIFILYIPVIIPPGEGFPTAMPRRSGFCAT